MRALSRAASVAALTLVAASVATGAAVPAGAVPIPSSNCDGAFHLFENTSQGVHVKVFTNTVSPNEVWVCARVEQVPGGTGKGGQIIVKTGTPGAGVGNVQTPVEDGDTGACALGSTVLPGSRPLASGYLANVPFLIDAALTGGSAQVCVLAGDEVNEHLLVPVAVPTVTVNPGSSVTFVPDPGT